MEQKKISDFLKEGKENAISAEKLADTMGCKNVRILQELIAAERAAGAVIISSTTGGYYLPANKREIQEFCKTLENRANNTLQALRSAKAALKE